MLIPPGRSRSAALLLPVGLAFGLIATVCGGGSSKPTTTTTSPPTTAAAAASPTGGGAGGPGGLNSQLTAFRACMASHGEPLPTRPPRSSTTQGTGTTVAPDSGTGGPGGAGGGGGFGGGGFFLGGGGGGGTGFLLRGLNQNDPKVMAAYNACKGQIPASLIQAQQQRSQALSAFISCMSDHGVTISTARPRAGTTRTTIDQSSPAYQTCKVLLPNGGAFGPRGSTTTTTAS